jgi:hypothetical protein
MEPKILYDMPSQYFIVKKLIYDTFIKNALKFGWQGNTVRLKTQFSFLFSL